MQHQQHTANLDLHGQDDKTLDHIGQERQRYLCDLNTNPLSPPQQNHFVPLLWMVLVLLSPLDTISHLENIAQNSDILLLIFHLHVHSMCISETNHYLLLFLDQMRPKFHYHRLYDWYQCLALKNVVLETIWHSIYMPVTKLYGNNFLQYFQYIFEIWRNKFQNINNKV